MRALEFVVSSGSSSVSLPWVADTIARRRPFPRARSSTPRDACSTAATASSGCTSKAISDEREEARQLVGHDRLGEGRLRADLVVDGLPAHPDLLGEAAHGHRRPAVPRRRLDGSLDDAPRIVVA